MPGPPSFVLGCAAFYAAKHGNLREVELLIKELQSALPPDDDSRIPSLPPRWLRKLAMLLNAAEISEGKHRRDTTATQKTKK